MERVGKKACADADPVEALRKIGSILRDPKAHERALLAHLQCARDAFGPDAEYEEWLRALLPLTKKMWFYGYLQPAQVGRACKTLRGRRVLEPQGNFFCVLSYDVPGSVVLITRGADKQIQGRTVTIAEALAQNDAVGMHRRCSEVFPYDDDNEWDEIEGAAAAAAAIVK